MSECAIPKEREIERERHSVCVCAWEQHLCGNLFLFVFKSRLREKRAMIGFDPYSLQNGFEVVSRLVHIQKEKYNNLVSDVAGEEEGGKSESKTDCRASR